MKKIIAITLIALFWFNLIIAQNVLPIKKVQKTQCLSFKILPALRTLGNKDQVKKMNSEENERQGYDYYTELDDLENLNNSNTYQKDLVRQAVAPANADNMMEIANFEGVLDLSNSVPDPTGSRGPNHYVQAVNNVYMVFDLEGNQLIDPVPLDDIWGDDNGAGDPIVMYDQYEDRWLITQLEYDGTSFGSFIAISATSDPTGEYYAYNFFVSGINDFPKFSIWSDAYYMGSANLQGNNVSAFEKEKMLVGDPTAGVISLKTESGIEWFTFFSMLPSFADGELPPFGTPCYFFHYGDDAWNDVSVDHIKIFEFQIDWENPNNSSLVLTQELATPAFSSVFTERIPQPESEQGLITNSNRITYRAQYRRWLGYNTMMLTHTINTDGENTAGCRWYELRQQEDNMGVTGEWKIHQSGTFAPEDGKSRWNPTSSMDKHGNIGMAYNFMGPDDHMSIAVTGRLSTDELGLMTSEECIVMEGLGSKEGYRSGDYNHMSLSPDGEEFWTVAMYVGEEGESRTRVHAFKFDEATVGVDSPEGSVVLENIYQIGSNINFEVENLPTANSIEVQLFDSKGALIVSKELQQLNNSVKTQIYIGTLPNGIYFVRYGNEEFQQLKKHLSFLRSRRLVTLDDCDVGVS